MSIKKAVYTIVVINQVLAIQECCPGMVATDMSGHMGATIDEGADTPLYLAIIAPNAIAPKGEFVAERKSIGFPNL